jgi:hypothetical protein
VAAGIGAVEPIDVFGSAGNVIVLAPALIEMLIGTVVAAA